VEANYIINKTLMTFYLGSGQIFVGIENVKDAILPNDFVAGSRLTVAGVQNLEQNFNRNIQNSNCLNLKLQNGDNAKQTSGDNNLLDFFIATSCKKQNSRQN
jgi:hypothetical protein